MADSPPATNGSASPAASPRSSISSENSRSPRGHRRSSSTASIADSPLQQVNVEPEPRFKLKVNSVYEQLFAHKTHAPGYWIEFFLLPVNKELLAETIRNAAPLSQHEETVQTLVSASIANLGPKLPADIVLNALSVLTTVFTETLDLSIKRAPTASVIQVLAGIDRATQVFDDLTASLIALLKHSDAKIAGAATQTVLDIARKSWGTPLNTLFSTKNFFAAFISIINKQNESAAVAFVALGVLTALNTYDDDGVSVYLQRVNDYVDEAVMSKIIVVAQRSLVRALPAESAKRSNRISGWLSSWFSEPAEPAEPLAVNTTDSSDTPTWQVALPLHFFVLNNPIFSQSLASSPALVTVISAAAPQFESALKSRAAFSNTWLVLLLLRKLVDSEFEMLADPSVASIIRIEASKLALDTSRRVPLAGILDLAQVGLRAVGSSKKPDTQLLQQIADLINQVCAQMVLTNTMWQYNWPPLWKTVMGLIKHLAARAAQEPVVASLLNTVVGMSLRRDVLDEEDWSYLIYSIVQNTALFDEVVRAFPSLEKTPAVLAARAMAAQYELTKESPDLSGVMRQGKLAAGRVSALVGDKHRPFSVLTEPVMKKIMKTVVKGEV